MGHIALGVSSSISIYKACEIIRRLLKDKFSLNIVMTRNATRLISPRVFSCLVAGPVYWDEFLAPDNWEIEHISLAKRADLILIAPATADIIAKLASGISDELLTSTVLATKAPVVIAPAMNENMYNHPLTQANIKKLKSIGYKFIGPVKGKLATGEVGIGHLAKVEDIVSVARKLLAR